MNRIVQLGIAFAGISFFTPNGVLHAKEPDVKLKVLMHTFRTEMQSLQPLIVSEEKFRDPKVHTKIEKALARLQEKADSSISPTLQAQPGYRLNLAGLSYHFKKTKEAFDLGAFELARQNLNATGAYCITCHSQLPQGKGGNFPVWGELPADEPASLPAAEYLFILRNFDAALKVYDELARQFPKSDLKREDFAQLYRRKLALFARVKRDPELAIKNLSADLANKKIPADVAAEVRNWIKAFEELKKVAKKPETLGIESLLGFVKEQMPGAADKQIMPNDGDIVRFLYLSGLVFERLSSDLPATQAQEFLILLAEMEKQLGKKYWYSMHQAYLRDCVLGYPKSDLSKKCFELYKRDTEEQFAGRAQIPPAARQSIESLERYVQ